MIKKTIKISGIEVVLSASAATPGLYRAVFPNDDILKQMVKIQKQVENDETPDLQVFERMVFIMSGAPFKKVGMTMTEWAEQFDDMFGIYEAIPDLIDMWNNNSKTQEIPKKNEV